MCSNEYEYAGLSEKEVKELGGKELRLPILIEKAYEMLELITFLTTGPDETRAWTVKRGTEAPKAAGVIHSDFEKLFIRATVIQWDKLIEAGGLAEAISQGLVRTEGKEYVVQDGDIMDIKHG